MGMLKEGVRLDRVRGGRQKYRRNPTTHPYQLQIYQPNTNTAPTSLDDIKLLEILSMCEPDLLSIGTPHIELMYNKSLSCLSDDKKGLTDDKSDIFMEHRVEADVHEMLSILSDIYDKELVGVIGWAKQIPGKLIERGMPASQPANHPTGPIDHHHFLISRLHRVAPK